MRPTRVLMVGFGTERVPLPFSTEMDRCLSSGIVTLGQVAACYDRRQEDRGGTLH